MLATLSFRPAVTVESAQVAHLVNASYRGESSRQGWTTEADLLDGLRTSADEVRCLIESEHHVILLCARGTEILGSVCLEKHADVVHVGMFVVSPAMQGLGVGKQLLTYAEVYAQKHWGVKRFSMHVITLRHELIEFYVRRGYRRTGLYEAFPVNPEVWQPKVSGLQLEVLEKSV